MPKKRRQARIPTPAWERPRGTIGSRVLGRSSQFYGAVAIAVLVGLALSIVAFAFVSDELDKRGRPGSTAIAIDDTRFRLDYFSDRLKIYVDQTSIQNSSAAQPASAIPTVADLIIQEEIVRRFASEMDVAATDEEIQEAIAGRLGISADDDTFDVVFQQELTRSGLSDTDYRQMIEAEVLSDNLREKFAAEVPESAESVRFRQIVVGTDEEAQDLRSQIEGGADFAALAAENSLDTQTGAEGGEVGWVPSGVFDASTEELVFTLEVGEVTTIPTRVGVLVIEMEEKAADRAIDEEQKGTLADRAFDDWVEEKQASLSVVNNLDLGGGDPDKINWAVDHAYQTAGTNVTGAGHGG